MEKLTSIELVIKLIGGKWKCLILYHLIETRQRNRDFLHLLEGVSQKVLTEQLRQLEEDGLIAREIFPEVPPRVEYFLTKEGNTFIPVLNFMCEWGYEYDKRNLNLVKPCCNLTIEGT